MLTAIVAVAAMATPERTSAAYLENAPQEFVQPDGTRVRCLATGDEHYHWLHDDHGFVIVRDPATGFFVYADKAAGRLMPTACRAGVCDPLASGLQPNLKPDPGILREKQARSVVSEARLTPRPEKAPTFAAINALVIFVRFSDQTAFTNPLSTYAGMYNASTGSSMHTYFLEASYGQTAISGTFYPPSGGISVLSYQDSHPRAYYQPYDAVANPQGYIGSIESALRELTLVQSACEAIASLVSPALNIDTNGDGYVDNVTLIVRGAADALSDVLWSHHGVLSSYTATINDKEVYDYNFQLDGALSVSVLCHEMGHTLGAPDLFHYDTCSSEPDLDPVWRWDLMANNLNPPQHSGAYLKKTYFGWIATIPEITTSGTYTLNPITSSTNNAYTIASPNSTDEYFVVEYRQASGTFESSLPGSGLLVYRIYPGADPVNPGNRCGPPDEVYVYRPNGTTSANGDPATAFFSAGAGRTAIDDSTNPSSFLSDGSPGGLSISNVTTAGGTISFTVTIGGTCSYSIDPTSTSAAASGGSGSVTVTTGTGCAWTAVSNNAWITVTGGSSGSGNGTVSYSVGANSSASPRTGTVTIAGQTLTVNQGGATCSYSINPTWDDVPAEGHSGSVEITAGTGCAWTATSNESWITITGGTSGSGSGSVTYDVAANTASSPRIGTMTIAALTFTVSQVGVSCDKLISPTSASFPAAGGGGTVAVTTASGCTWSASSNAAWITITDGSSGSGSGSVSYSVASNADLDTRSGTMTVAGVTFTVTQAGSSCPKTVDPLTVSVSASGGPGTITVTADTGCTWTASSNTAWISIESGASGSGNGTVGYAVSANSASSPRTGTLTVAAQNVTFTQSGVACTSPAVTSQPVGQTIGLGQTATLTVTASGTAPLSYQWYRGTTGDTSDPLTGANSSTYVTSPLPETTSFWVRVSNACGSADSVTAVITVTAVCQLTCSVTAPKTMWPFIQERFTGIFAAPGCTATPTFLWEFGDGESATAQSPEHAYWSTGAYTWRFTVTVGSLTCVKTGTVMVLDYGEGLTYLVPSVAHSPGALDTQWRTDLAILNVNDSPATVQVAYFSEAAPVNRTIVLAPGETAEWRDVLVSLIELGETKNSKGTLHLESDAPLFITSRTYNQAPTGTFGQYYPALSLPGTFGADQVGVLMHLKKNAGFRTNIGVLNLDDEPCLLEVQLFDHLGAQVGSTIARQVEGERWLQIDDPFSAAGAGQHDIAYAFVEAQSSTCKIWAYASVIDNVTGDPTTIPVQVLEP